MKIAVAAVLSLLFLLVGCINTHTMPVEYGAEADPNNILAALNTPIAAMKATDVKVGEFVTMETTQDIALGESFNIVGMTGATITDKAEDANRVIYSGVLHQLSLESDGTYSKVSREGEVLCASKTACACGECSSTTEASKTQTLIGSKQEPLAPAIARKTLVAQSLGYTPPAQLVSSMATTSSAALLPTYHNFSTWLTQERPPANVTAVPGCLGIANCLINITHVNFDEVYWDKPQGTKVHVEAMVSPDVPYLSRNLSTCQTLLVNVGTSGSNVLLKQCSNVFDFRFQAE